MFAVLAIVALHVIPLPPAVTSTACRSVSVPRTVSRTIDSGALDELNERWTAIGLRSVHGTASAGVTFAHDGTIAPQGYRVRVDSSGVTIASSDGDGAFYGVMTLAQLPVRVDGRWQLPCVEISDAPKLRWRVLSDDVSRGPLPTMRYFKERIRTIAAFKMNGYSPYMEHVFLSPADPLPAPLDGITPEQLRELKQYAARYHVTFIPEQQTFAHMHNTLRVEQYAKMAEFPHGFLLSPNVPESSAYLSRLIGQEREALGDVPFFHIGSDETATLGEGQTAAYVAANGGRSAVYAEHITQTAQLVAPARVMLWDDGIESDPSIMKHIPKNAVIVNWHYGAEPSYMRYISTIADGGFDQMVAPGANNWSEIFPDLNAALPNERRFITEGITAHVLGLFQTVWHDDGETLFESTWYPVLYSAAIAWGGDRAAEPFSRDFPSAFFGSDDAGYARDIELLGGMDARMPGASNKRFWADPFNPYYASLMANVDIPALRLAAEEVETHLYFARPPLHRNAADVMLLAARRYDALGRRYQIAQEVRYYYDHAKTHPADGERDLYWCKYWLWEQRDTDEALEPLYAQAWRYEDRESHLASNLERYHLDAQTAIERADAIDRVTYELYEKKKPLPDLETLIQ
ncbi:MAG: family 20 glycosylhydrolase [Candidatus Eremiobacteraeota bacterium]|nr:family 20 glycosylhydrolase [Candidatus Eremiobacteraeota bacterium]